MGKKLIQVEVVERLKKKNIIALSEYTGYRKNIKVKCLICENIWETQAGILCRQVCGCPKCGLKKSKQTIKWKLTTKDFFERLPTEIFDSIELLEEYKSCFDRIKVKCKKCNFEWNPKAIYLSSGRGCWKCGHDSKGLKHRHSHEDFLKEINEFHDGSIQLLSLYKNGKSSIKFNCIHCNNVQEKKACQLRRRGCSFCFYSKGEFKIKKILDENKISYKQQYTFDNLKLKNLLRFDFGILDENGKLLHLIEYDGPQHTICDRWYGGKESFEKLKLSDNMKNNYCEKNNIKLTRISYKNFKTFTLKDIME